MNLRSLLGLGLILMVGGAMLGCAKEEPMEKLVPPGSIPPPDNLPGGMSKKGGGGAPPSTVPAPSTTG